MKNQKPSLTVLFASSLLLLALVTLFASLSNTTTHAQTTSPASKDAPVLTAAPGDGVIDLSWNEVTGASRYELQGWTTGTGWFQLDDGTLTANSYTHRDASAGTTYWYTVRGIFANSDPTNWSEHKSAALPGSQSATSTSTPTPAATASPTPTQSPLSAPSLTAQPGNNVINVTWTTVPSAVRYELYVWRSADVDWVRLDDGSLTANAYTHSDPTSGTRYSYTVRGVYASGPPTAWSEYQSATLPEAPSTPSASSTATRPPPPPPPRQPPRQSQPSPALRPPRPLRLPPPPQPQPPPNLPSPAHASLAPTVPGHLITFP